MRIQIRVKPVNPDLDPDLIQLVKLNKKMFHKIS